MPVGYSIYVKKASFIHDRVDPRTKMFVLATVFVLALAFNHPAVLALITAAVLGIARIAKIPVKSLRTFLGAATWFFILGILLWPFYIDQGTTLFHLGSNAITDDGILFGIAMGLRVALMVTAAGVWMMTTSPQMMTQGLLRLGLPYKAGMAVSSSIRFVPLINAERLTIMEAQRARGLDLTKGNSFSRAVRSVAVIGPMLVRALDLAQALAIAMDARAFGAQESRTSIHEIHLSRSDRAIQWVCLGLILLGIVLRILGIGLIVKNYL